jgi:hypothetical protein
MVGGLLSRIPQADVIADCGRIGRDGPFYDLLAEAEAVVLITRASVAEVVRLRDRATALANGLQRRGRPGARVGVVVIADHKTFRTALAEVRQVIGDGRSPASVIGGLAYEPKSASQLRGQWGGKLDKSLLIRTAREVAGNLLGQLPDAQLPGDLLPDTQLSGVRLPDSRLPDAQGPEAQPFEAQPFEALPPRPAAAGTGLEVTDHPGPLSGPPSATVPGVPAARPGDPGGW